MEAKAVSHSQSMCLIPIPVLAQPHFQRRLESGDHGELDQVRRRALYRGVDGGAFGGKRPMDYPGLISSAR